MEKLKNILIGLVLVMALSSCEEVIEIDLNSANPAVVAEGYIEKGSTAWISLRYTTDYFHTEEAELIEDAIVSLSDDRGNSEVLEYHGDGVYRGSVLKGEEGTEYSISIELEEQVLSGNTFLANTPLIAGISYNKSFFQYPAEPGEEIDSLYTVTLFLQDEPENDNYYLLQFSDGGRPIRGFYLALDDSDTEDNMIVFPTFMLEYHKFDTVGISVYSIDKGAYTFYNQMNDALGIGPAMMSTPYNPVSNLGTDVMGYFMARAMVDTSFMILPFTFPVGK